jgi:hypothetical protein
VNLNSNSGNHEATYAKVKGMIYTELLPHLPINVARLGTSNLFITFHLLWLAAELDCR